MPCRPEDLLVFEYVAIVKSDRAFEFVPVAEYFVDRAAGWVRERTLSAVVSNRDAHAASPVHEGAQPGSYAPRPG